MRPGWKKKQLGEVCSFLNRGISPKYLETGGVCVLNQKCVRDHRISYQPSRRHDVQARKVDQERFLRAGDVLVNSTGTGTLGRVAQVRESPPEPTTVDSHVTIVRPALGHFYPEFFGYMLVVIEDTIKDAGEGCGGQTELARSLLAEKFSVCYPESLSEQRRLVGILDDAFDGIATAKANAEKNLQNARAVFESHLEAIFTRRGKGWMQKKLANLIEIQNGFAFKSNDYTNSGYFVMRIGNVQDGQIALDNPKYIQLADKRLERFILHEGDILISLTGNIGRVGIVQEEHLPAVLNQRVARITVSCRSADRDFVFRFLSSCAFRESLQEAGHGAAQQNVSAKEIESITLHMPALAEQRQIAERLDLFAAETQRLTAIYQQKITALDNLKKSLLHHAFTGQL